jgi:hypothetical protein
MDLKGRQGQKESLARQAHRVHQEIPGRREFARNIVPSMGASSLRMEHADKLARPRTAKCENKSQKGDKLSFIAIADFFVFSFKILPSKVS